VGSRRATLPELTKFIVAVSGTLGREPALSEPSANLEAAREGYRGEAHLGSG
jgi:hypothetical protein